MSAHTELLEEYLRTAPIIYQGTWPHGGAHQNKMELILEGGLGAIAKPADWADGPRTVQCECAAWTVAKLFGWEDLLAVTVLREVKSIGDQLVDAAVQIAWPRPTPDLEAAFDDRDVWQAATFDYVIENSDRGGHNWLAVPGDAQTPMLKLIDHGYAFGAPGRPFQSTFFGQREGQDLPSFILDDLGLFLTRAHDSGLRDGLPEGEFERLIQRAEELPEGGKLERP